MPTPSPMQKYVVPCARCTYTNIHECVYIDAQADVQNMHVPAPHLAYNKTSYSFSHIHTKDISRTCMYAKAFFPKPYQTCIYSP